jgi:putative spermidine/putrescine transport system ATP-binding protein
VSNGQLEVSGLRASYGGPTVVDGLDLTVPAGTLTALLGPSGCGKSTLLRTVAGLLDPDTGDVTIGGVSLLGTPAERRPVGLVFQKPLLFGHLSVGDNVGFGLRMRRVGRVARRRRAAEMLERVGLEGFAGRRVGELSGGQEQRVALARALVLDPQVLLLDEPFSQLDAGLRGRMRELVRAVQRELGVTTLFVTHDQQEAVDLADAVALMLDGRIEAHGAPAAFYTRPATLRAARFFGVTNEIAGTVRGRRFRCAVGTLQVHDGSSDGPGVLVVRPETVRVGVPMPAGGGGPANALRAVVRSVRFRGTHQTVVLGLAGGLDITADVSPALRIEAGDEVTVQLPPAACHVLPAGGPPAETGSVRSEPLPESEHSSA